jgi:hypothetical protein
MTCPVTPVRYDKTLRNTLNICNVKLLIRQVFISMTQ